MVLDGAGVGLVVVVRDVNVKAAVSLSSVGRVAVERDSGCEGGRGGARRRFVRR